MPQLGCERTSVRDQPILRGVDRGATSDPDSAAVLIRLLERGQECVCLEVADQLILPAVLSIRGLEHSLDVVGQPYLGQGIRERGVRDLIVVGLDRVQLNLIDLQEPVTEFLDRHPMPSCNLAMMRPTRWLTAAGEIFRRFAISFFGNVFLPL